jgi:hypothetical protein
MSEKKPMLKLQRFGARTALIIRDEKGNGSSMRDDELSRVMAMLPVEVASAVYDKLIEGYPGSLHQLIEEVKASTTF